MNRAWAYLAEGVTFTVHADGAGVSRAREAACPCAATAGVADRLVFEQIAAEKIPAAGRFDLVMVFNWIQDMANPRGAPANIQRAQAGRRPDVVQGERFGPTRLSVDPGAPRLP